VLRFRKAPYNSLHALVVVLFLSGLAWYLGCAGGDPRTRSPSAPLDSAPSGNASASGEIPAQRPTSLPSTQQMLILCWDGAQYDHVMTAVREGELPNLARIIRAGGVSETLITDHATETKSAHAQMFCGYGPDITGNLNAHQFRPLARELAVFGRLNQHFGAENIQQIWVTSKDVRVSSLPGEVWQYCRLDFDIWDGDIHRSCEITGPLIISYLQTAVRRDEPFLFFGHFTEPDSPGHSKGENSPYYHGSIIMLDRWLGDILDTLDAVGLADTTAVCVCSDHGFDEDKYTHKNAPDAWFATDLARLRPLGDQKDMAPTILSAFGVGITRMDPAMPGRPLWADWEPPDTIWPAKQSVRTIAWPPQPLAADIR
jgi:hypothetical protein